MKKIFQITILLTAFIGAVSSQVNWQTIEQASQVATNKNQKMYFIDFYTSWCGWCKKMERDTFSDPVVAAILNKYYIPVRFDAEGSSTFSWNGTKYSNTTNAGNRAQTHPFTRAILGQKIGYPSFAVFTKTRSLKQILQGYQSAYDFSMVLWYLCTGDDQQYTWEEYQRIFPTEIKPEMMKKLGL